MKPPLTLARRCLCSLLASQIRSLIFVTRDPLPVSPFLCAYIDIYICMGVRARRGDSTTIPLGRSLVALEKKMIQERETIYWVGIMTARVIMRIVGETGDGFITGVRSYIG